jgi:hypothetical protein
VFRWLRQRRTRRRGIGVSAVGLGPFPRSTLEAFRCCMCSACGVPISENTLFGNALVISAGRVEILCSRCRTGVYHALYPDHPFNASSRKSKGNNSVDRVLVIGEIAELMQEKNHGMSWLDIVLCLRGGVGGLQQIGGRRPYSGLSAECANRGRARYGRPLPGSCAECGARWANEWQMSHNQVPAGRESSERCWACAFPLQNTWFMRRTLAEETALLEGPQGTVSHSV